MIMTTLIIGSILLIASIILHFIIKIRELKKRYEILSNIDKLMFEQLRALDKIETNTKETNTKETNRHLEKYNKAYHI